MQRRELLLLALALIALGPTPGSGQVLGSEKRRLAHRRLRARLRRRRAAKKKGDTGEPEDLGMPRGPDRDYDGIPDRLENDDGLFGDED